MSGNNNTWKKHMIQFMIAGIVFFTVTMPFRYYFSLMSVTEIRPAAALPPFFGMVFGLPGALGCAVFNLIADLVSGYSLSMSAVSFPIQFLMGAIPYFLWYHIPAVRGEKITFPKMDQAAHVVKYLLIILCNSAVITFLLGMVMNIYGIAGVFSQTTHLMFWNNLDFGFMLGMPLLILVGIRKGRRFSLNERLILIFLLLAILAATLTGVGAWLEAAKVSADRIYLWNRIYLDVAVAMNIFLFVEIMFLIYLEKKITIPIQNLADYAGDYVKLGGEELNPQKFIDACETYADDRMEVGHLARSYIRMISDLDVYMENLKSVTAEKERIGAELNVATQIQADMLPSIFPAFPGRKEFDIYATMNPAKEVGGDFYDFFLVDEDHLAMVMADVSGKGVPAALFMVIAKTLIKNRTQMGGIPAEILGDVNEQLCEGNEAELFVTVWLAILEISTGKGIAANAGHEHPVIKRADGAFELVVYRHSPAVATMEGIRFREHEFELHPGDMLYVYTDGVAEATNTADELYGTERMLEVLNRNRDKSMAELLFAVREDIDRFVGDDPQFDDITMLGFLYSGPSKETGGAHEAADDFSDREEQEVRFQETEKETVSQSEGNEDFDIEGKYWEQIDKSIGLIRERRHAEKASREKSAFLSNMSHEIRTPINAVLGMDEMILRECQDEQILEYAWNIKNAGNSLLALINDILDFSKIEAGKMDIIPVDYEVAAVIHHLVTMIRKRAEDKGLELIVRVNEKIPHLLHGDEIRIRQIITNILTNAVKYTESGSVTLSMDYQEKTEETIGLKVSVKDTGIGIKKEDIEKLFSAFERIEEERNRSIEGTGLGMNITTQLLHMMGSQLVVESVYGEGSEFSFTLEQKVIDREPVGNLEEAMKRSMQAGKAYRESFTAPEARILVIDDTPMNLSVIKGLLKQTRVQIDTGESGAECLKMIGKKKYDMVFLDHRMSGMDGIETFRAMQEMPAYKEHEMPVIALTANAVSGAREEYISAGFTDYLTKPVDPEKLESMLIKYLPAEKVQLKEKSIDIVTDDEAAGRKSGGNTDISDSTNELPEWLAASGVLDTKEGLKRCGTAEVYADAVKEYVENIMDTADEIERLFQAEDWNNYTIKVHALKSTSAIIGATEVSEKAKELEAAGNVGDIHTIRENTAPLLEEYRRLFETLSVPDKSKSRDGLPVISMEQLSEAYEAVKEIASAFDYKGVSDVMKALEEYRIPPEEADRYEKLRKAVKNMDWDGIVDL